MLMRSSHWLTETAPEPLNWLRDSEDALRLSAALVAVAVLSGRAGLRPVDIGLVGSWKVGTSLALGLGVCAADFWLGSIVLRQDFASPSDLVAAVLRTVVSWPVSATCSVASALAGAALEEWLRCCVIVIVARATGSRLAGVGASLLAYLATHSYLDASSFAVIVVSGVLYSLLSLRRVDFLALLSAHASYNILLALVTAGLAV